MVNIATVKNMVGLSSKDEAELTLYHTLITQHQAQLQGVLEQWVNEFVPEAGVEEVFTEGFLGVFHHTVVGDAVFAAVYQQTLLWQGFNIQEIAVIVLLSRIRRCFVELAEVQHLPALARAFCHLVDAVQAVVGTVYQLARTLERLQERSAFEIKRVENMFLMIEQSPPQALLNAYKEHQRWKHVAYEAALGQVENIDGLALSPTQCELGHWLEAGGWSYIPLDKQAGFKAAHERVHVLGKQVLDDAKSKTPNELISMIWDIEEASDDVGTVLLELMDKVFVEVATLDALTGLPNRRSFERDYHQGLKLAKRYGLYVGLHLLDVDHFKKINDTYGHLKGDEVLRGFAQTLHGALREEDKLYRWGGEEFALLTFHKESGGSEKFAGRLFDFFVRQDLAAQLKIERPVTMSMATVEVSPDGNELPMDQRVFASVDILLYRAKEEGRNQAWAGAVNEKGYLRENTLHRIRP